MKLNRPSATIVRGLAILAAICLVASQQAVGKGDKPPANLLPNPSFEEKTGNGVSGWATQAWSGKDRVLLTIELCGRTDKRCVSIQSSKGSDAAWITKVKVQPNTRYELSGWIKTRGIVGAKGAMMNVQALRGSETRAVTDTNDWTRVSRVFTTGSQGEIQVNCLFGGWGRSTGQAWYDDVSLVKVPGQPDRKPAPVAAKKPAPVAAKKPAPPAATDAASTNSADFDPKAIASLPPMAFVKRHHLRRPFGMGTIYCWNVYSPGGGIYVYDPARPDSTPKEIFRRDYGTVYDMSPSFDAKKLLFSWMAIKPDPAFKPTGEVGYRKNIDSFHVYEINVDGTGLRQITTGRFHDVHPIYLPDGRICFTSTRGKSYSMCQPGLSSALFTMNADGTDIRRIEFSTLACMSPYVLDDGSVLFTRWEYQDKSLFTLQSLWTVNPDGTRVQLFFGNTITNPNVIWQAKPIPGTKDVLCILGPHHGNPVGALGIVSREHGMENPKGIRNITREYNYVPSKQVHAGGGPGDRQFTWAWRDPWPVREDLFLAAYGGPLRGGPKRYRIYAVDPAGNKALVFEDRKISCFNPVPLMPRTPPRVMVPIARSDKTYGTFFLQDVYKGIEDKGIQRGRVKAIRILTQGPKPCNMRGRREFDHDPVISRGSYYTKGCFGTVPVEKDGSAHFKAPAGVELYFEALDADGKELIRMGSTTQIMPGERQSCIGCHEPRTSAGSVRLTTAMRRAASEIAPPPWGHGGAIDFVRDVQPVFDKHCVKCHSGAQPKKGLDLSNDKSRYFNMAYGNLLDRNLVHYIYINRGLTDNFKPLETGSHRSKLVAHLDAGHSKVKLSNADKRRLYTWIDANCPYYGTYDNTRPGTAGSRDLWRDKWQGRQWRSDLDKALAMPGDNGKKGRRPRIGNQSINLTHPEFSSILTLSLAKSAGGQADDKNATFKDKTDPRYLAALKAIQAGASALAAKPRVDMPDAKPVPYPTDFGGLYTGFAGP